jgi:hypothetical protein
MININILSYFRKDKSTLLVFSAATLMLLLASPVLPLSNLLLQPAQAQSSLSFRTTEPADGSLCTRERATLTFDAQGTPSSSNPQHVDITSGTFQVTNSSGGILYSGNKIIAGSFTNNTSGGSLGLAYGVNHVPTGPTCVTTGHQLFIDTSCSTTNFNDITTRSSAGNDFGDFTGAVECSQGGGNTASSMTGSTQDSDGDGDGIPDSSDRCANNSNSRCYIDAR